MSLTVITCTGGRPEAFALCERWVACQTFRGPYQWIVVDDCDPATVISMGQQLIRPEPRWSGEPTLGRNLSCALHEVYYDKILFIEDDDYIPNGYFSKMSVLLDGHDLVGEAPAIYYHVVDSRYRMLRNQSHASLGQTGIRKTLLSDLLEIASREQKFLDLPLWAGGNLLRRSKLVEPSVIGMKGMPGRVGIGMGHRLHPQPHWESDQDGSILKSWIGSDAEFYRQFKRAA